jgi:hypothetical protein
MLAQHCQYVKNHLIFFWCWGLNPEPHTCSTTDLHRQPDLYTIRFFFFFFDGPGILTKSFAFAKQSLYHISHTSSPVCSGYFGDEVSRTICLGWSWTVILLISASQVVRIRHETTGNQLWIVYFKWVNYMVYELHLHKAVLKNKVCLFICLHSSMQALLRNSFLK